jgi:hypothetical protein
MSHIDLHFSIGMVSVVRLICNAGTEHHRSCLRETTIIKTAISKVYELCNYLFTCSERIFSLNNILLIYL